jgi:hypothetical protein
MSDEKEDKTFSTQEGPRKVTGGKPQWEDKQPAPDPLNPDEKK